MKYPVATLQSLYYLNPGGNAGNGVIFEISATDDSHNNSCGYNPLELPANRKTMTSEAWQTKVKDEEHEGESTKYMLLSSDGTNVTLLDYDKCKAIFPCIKVTYKYKVMKSNNAVDYIQTKYKYYWLQNRIKDGDMLTSGVFNAFAGHHNGKTDFVADFVEEAKEYIGRMVSNGSSYESLKATLPFYLTTDTSKVNEDNPVKIEGVWAHSLSVESGSTSVAILTSETQVSEYVENAAKEAGKSAAEAILKKYEATKGKTATVTIS